MPRTTTSIRLSDTESALVDAWAAYLTAKHGTEYNASTVLRRLLRGARTPDEAGVEAAALRKAHAECQAEVRHP